MHHTLHLIPQPKICVYCMFYLFICCFYFCLFSFSLQPFLKHSALFQIISLSLFSAVALFLHPPPHFFFPLSIACVCAVNFSILYPSIALSSVFSPLPFSLILSYLFQPSFYGPCSPSYYLYLSMQST